MMNATEQQKAEKFDRIARLEWQLRLEKDSVRWIDGRTPDYVAAGRYRAMERAQQRLFAAIDGLTWDELSDYGIYRRGER